MKSLVTVIIMVLFVAACQSEDGNSPSNSPQASTPGSAPASPSQVTPASGSPSEGVPKNEHQVGNGGGGICLGDRCLTLAEAGLRTPASTEEYYVLPPVIVNAVKEVLIKLPLASYRDLHLEQAIGNGKTFKRLDVVDPAKLEVIRKRYAEQLKDSRGDIRIEDVRIFAFAGRSESGNFYITYLLPEFFKLSPSQQAKILIHEKNVRFDLTTPQFREVLEFDGMIEDLLQNPNLILDQKFDLDRWENLAFNLTADYRNSGFRTPSGKSTIANWLARLQHQSGSWMDVLKVCKFPYFCEPDSKLISAHYEVPSGFIQSALAVSYMAFNNSDEEKSKHEEEDREICEKNLGAQDSIWLLRPVKIENADYDVYLLRCSRVNHELTVNVNSNLGWM